MLVALRVLAIAALAVAGFASHALANGSIKVCHCSGSQVASSNVALNNMDGDGVYSKTTMNRGDCKTLHCTITACFVVFKHYEADTTQTTDSALASGTVAYGWGKATSSSSKYEYVLGYGGKCE